MMTKKHFKAIANILSRAIGVDIGELKQLAYSFADYLATENPRFNKSKFIDAVMEDK